MTRRLTAWLIVGATVTAMATSMPRAEASSSTTYPSKFAAGAGDAPTGYVLNTELYPTSASNGVTFTDTTTGTVIHCTSEATVHGSLKVGPLAATSFGSLFGTRGNATHPANKETDIRGCTSPAFPQAKSGPQGYLFHNLFLVAASATAAKGYDDLSFHVVLVTSSGDVCELDVLGGADFHYSNQYQTVAFTGTSNYPKPTDRLSDSLQEGSCGSSFALDDSFSVAGTYKYKASDASFNPLVATRYPPTP